MREKYILGNYILCLNFKKGLGIFINLFSMFLLWKRKLQATIIFHFVWGKNKNGAGGDSKNSYCYYCFGDYGRGDSFI